MATIQERLRDVNGAELNKPSDYARGWNAAKFSTRQITSEAADVIDALVGAVRDKFCPRPCNNRPDQFDVGDCVDAGECGCSAVAALSLARGD